MQTLTPLLCSATTTHPLGLRVQSPEPAVESGLGLRAQGCAGSSLLIFTTSPVPKPELCHCRGHLSQGRELHSCLSAGGTFRWTEHLTSHIFNTKRGSFQYPSAQQKCDYGLCLFPGCRMSVTEGQKAARDFFPWIRKQVPLPAEAASFQQRAGTRGEGEEAA